MITDDQRRKIADAAALWERQGWALIDGLLPPTVVEAALSELTEATVERRPPLGPTRRPDQLDNEIKFRGSQFDGTTLFPIPGAPRLNRLFVHPGLRAFVEAALETDQLRIYQSRVWSKHGDHTNYEQPHHRDRNHSLVPVRNGPGWGHVELFVYLHDVDATNGAPKLVPGAADGLGGAGTGMPTPADAAPELYATEVTASGSAGSVLAYRSDVWHRGADIEAGAERHVLVVSFRPAAVDWIGFDAHEPLVNSPDFVAFAQECTPDELALFGVPKPGHAFWTAEVVDAMATIYPELDLTPWREQLVHRPD